MGERNQVSGLRALMDPAMAVGRAEGRFSFGSVLIHDGSAEFVVDGRHSSFAVASDGSYDFDDLLKAWVSVRGQG